MLNTTIKTILRILWVTIVNLYCIPTHIIIMGVTRPLLWVVPDLYWKMEGYLFRWLLMMVVNWMWTAGYTITDCGEDISMCTEDECLITVNHQSTADVPTLMHGFCNKGMVPNRVFWIMDVLFKYTHFGWVSQIRGDFFIRQGKDTRHLQGAMLAQHMKESYWSRGHQWIILFPEGGFLRKRRLNSQEFAKKKGLPKLEHVTLPRIGAMKTILDIASPAALKSNGLVKSDIKPVKWLIDITIGYPEGKPLDMQTIAGGYRKPCTTKLYYRKYPIEEIPLDTEGMTTWLYDRFIEKEQLLKTFYATGSFPAVSDTHGDSQVNTKRNLVHRMPEEKMVWTWAQLIPPHLFYMITCYLAWSNIFAGMSAIYPYICSFIM